MQPLGALAMSYDGCMDAPRMTPLDEAVDRVGDRWSFLLVEALLSGPLRFGELRAVVPGIAANILAQRLRRLEEKGVVVGQTYSERPPRRVYELTDEGQRLAGAIRLLAEWGARGAPGAEAMQHAACGTALEAHWYCPTCARTIADTEASDLRFI